MHCCKHHHQCQPEDNVIKGRVFEWGIRPLTSFNHKIQPLMKTDSLQTRSFYFLSAGSSAIPLNSCELIKSMPWGLLCCQYWDVFWWKEATMESSHRFMCTRDQLAHWQTQYLGRFSKIHNYTTKLLYSTVYCRGPCKCYVMQMGVGVWFSGKKRYEGVMFNVISVTRGWVGVQFPEKIALHNTWTVPSSSTITW